MNEQTIPSFASENFAGIHKQIFQALTDINHGHVPSYGKDRYTEEATHIIKELFGKDVDVYFTFNGTGANNFGLGCVTEPFQAIYCSDVAHLYVDESTAPETFIGCRIFPVPSQDGKIKLEELIKLVKRKGDLHHPQPRIISLSQPTEYGTVYTCEEISKIKEFCTQHNMLLHVDGARFCNAVAHLNISLQQLSKDVGIDILTLGGTKGGMMFGEAVLFFHNTRKASYPFQLKRCMQLASKNRFIAAQFKVWLENNLWLQIALHTNKLAQIFAKAICDIPQVKIAYPVQTNSVFINMPKDLYKKMRPFGSFYYWNEQRSEVRFVFSFDNHDAEIIQFVEKMKKIMG